MKNILHKYLMLSFCSLALLSCQSDNIDEEHHYDNKVFLTSKLVKDDLLITPEVPDATRTISYRLAKPLNRDAHLTFEAVPQMAAAYNLSFNDNAQALPAECYSIPNTKAVIKAGNISNEDVVVNFTNTHTLDNTRRYVLPVTIVDSDIEVVDSKRTVYFVFKGAALINVVADIHKIFFPVNWAPSTDMGNVGTITVEALVKSPDWVDGRGNALSSVFGKEGTFLVRIGDSDRPRDQLQCAAPGGNYPGPNMVSGLPVNEWVHIAVVYDVNTHERIYYKDGVKVYSDGNARQRFNISNGCFVGYAYDNTRWLPGEISELRVWNVVRTEEQISKNPYRVDPKSDGLVAYWKFNEGAGNIIRDHTGNGNDLKAANDGEPVWIDVELPKISE